MSILIQHYFKQFSIFTASIVLTGCSSLSYYSQSIQGQLEVIQKSEPIAEALKEKSTSEAHREKLNTVLELRKFSIEKLGLPDNDSYRSYSDLKRDYVIWNIFANPEFSLKPLNWCYLIVGCLSYRGYFSKADAEQYEKELKKEGYDTYLGGVAAYSTLGWFEDPVLNTMLRWDENYLASVIFHELAHQQLYIKNDSELNESYADAVAHIGVIKWLDQKTDKTDLHEYIQTQEREKMFVELINRYKTKLTTLYESSIDDIHKREKKKVLLLKMKREYFEMSQEWQNDPYGKWFNNELNNAKLASVITYRKYVPAFLEIYKKLNRDLTKFYSFANLLSNCKRMIRKEILNKRKIEFEC